MNHREDSLSYSVRESSRARRVSLKLSAKDGLEVVIPLGFDRKYVPGIIREKQEWIKKTLEKLEKGPVVPVSSVALPESIYFKAVDQHFSVQYVKRGSGAVELRRLNASLLRLSGDIENTKACQALLKWWLQQQGKIRLIPWLKRVSDQTGLQYRKAQIRGQRSRWGSCSSKGTISLNQKLLFLPPELVEYILIHELCHTAHPNHSSTYWALVSKLEPNYRLLDGRMKTAGEEVPHWAR